MCALFGPRVDVHAYELELDAHVWPIRLELAPAVHTGALIASTVRLAPLSETRATIRREPITSPAVVSRRHDSAIITAHSGAPVAMGLSVLCRAQPLPPFATSSRAVTGLELEGQAHPFNVQPRVRVRRDLAAARDRLVERRSVPARLLTEAQASHWRKRIADAKRLPIRQVDLIAIFPDVPLVGDQPVQYSHGTLSYRLPESPVPLTTVVIAKHLGTGEVLLGRFARS